MATGMSADRRVVVGSNLHNSVREAWIATVDIAAAEVAADFNDDGAVDGADLGLLFSKWGTVDTPFDLDGDGIVDGGDLGALLAAWTSP